MSEPSEQFQGNAESDLIPAPGTESDLIDLTESDPYLWPADDYVDPSDYYVYPSDYYPDPTEPAPYRWPTDDCVGPADLYLEGTARWPTDYGFGSYVCNPTEFEWYRTWPTGLVFGPSGLGWHRPASLADRFRLRSRFRLIRSIGSSLMRWMRSWL